MTFTGQNVTVYQDTNRTLEVTVYDADGAPLPISGYYFNYVVYKPTTGQVVITKTVGSGITITDGDNGIFEVDLVPAELTPLLGQYNHECGSITPAGSDNVIFTGYFKVIASKT